MCFSYTPYTQLRIKEILFLTAQQQASKTAQHEKARAAKQLRSPGFTWQKGTVSSCGLASNLHMHSVTYGCLYTHTHTLHVIILFNVKQKHELRCIYSLFSKSYKKGYFVNTPAYVTWSDVSYPFNGYCAPIENARVFIEMCNLCS